MDAMNLHHLAVPCIAKEKEKSETTYQGDGVFHLNPMAIIRYEPDGAVITPPMLYSSFLWVDGEAADLLRQRSFAGHGLADDFLNQLLENQVIFSEKPTKEKYREVRVRVSGLPTQVLLDVTSYCNCNCLACYHHADLNGHVPTLNELTERISALKQLGLTLVEVTGGEPFSRGDLRQVLNHISGQGMHFYVVTNGEYLAESSPELITELKRGLGLAVSLDGVGEVHDRIRRRPGLYDKVIKGLDMCRTNGLTTYLIATLSRTSMGCIQEMVGVAERFGTTIHFRPAMRTGAAIINMLESVDLARELGGLLRHPNVRNGLLSTKKNMPRSRYYGCGLRKRISVDSHGFLYPCVMDRSRHSRRIEEFTNVSLMAALEQETVEFLAGCENCRNCEHNKNRICCGGFCRFSKRHGIT
jgi:MoaA/NifB/PqqE/SkfB family radical SAM enzyme